MSDLISRQAAIDAIDRLDIPEDMCVFEILSHIELEIGNLPSAQPERKKGKWTIKNGELAIWDVCSECGRMVMHKAPFYNFCPNCGARMDGEEDG